jgi:actin-related protein 8
LQLLIICSDNLKRDDQQLTLRLQKESDTQRMVKQAKDRDRALAKMGATDVPNPTAVEGEQEDDGAGGNGIDATKIIVIHPGSQNLRIGLASDALPKTIPMCLALKWPITESQEYEALPKRQKLDSTADQQFGEDFSKQFAKLSSDLKVDMRQNKRKVLPNSKELIVNYNKRTAPEKIPEHNDPLRIEWTDVSKDDENDPTTYFAGIEAQRVPDDSDPPYKLLWPIRNGLFNERDYPTQERIYDDIESIIERALRKDLGLNSSIEWEQYSVVFVVPDLYDKKYIAQMLHMCLTGFVFKQVTFFQESLAASYGSGYSAACVVDIGAQKTSIACLEEGMILEDSRVNLKYGGADVTETFIRMMLHDHFPYQEINLMRRYDFLLAEELKIKCCTLNQIDVTTREHTFHLRAPNQPTMKYSFKHYDEIYLAPFGFFDPSYFDDSDKLRGRRKLIPRSYNAYDPDQPDDPTSAAQLAILTHIKPSIAQPVTNGFTFNGNGDMSTPQKERPNPFNHLARMDSQANGDSRVTSAAGSPAPEGANTPSLAPASAFGAAATNGSPGPSNIFHFGNGSHNSGTPGPPAGMFSIDPHARTAEDIAIDRDSVLPVAPLDVAIITSIAHGVKGDEKKSRDMLGGIMVVGGGAKTPGLVALLEEKLKARRPDLADKILVGVSPRDMDGQVVAWKGASVYARCLLHESWVGQLEYERLGTRALHLKAIWAY